MFRLDSVEKKEGNGFLFDGHGFEIDGGSVVQAARWTVGALCFLLEIGSLMCEVRTAATGQSGIRAASSGVLKGSKRVELRDDFSTFGMKHEVGRPAVGWPHDQVMTADLCGKELLRGFRGSRRPRAAAVFGKGFRAFKPTRKRLRLFRA